MRIEELSSQKTKKDVKETDPEVFIIESLRFSDEKKNLFEGDLLYKMLHLTGKKETQYYYIRTKKELKRVAKKFGKSKCRYLHISCHANKQGMKTTLDDVSYVELGEILKPHLDNRRVFVSACQMACQNLAENIFPKAKRNNSAKTCNSLVGPKDDISFGDAAALWAAFYNLRFKANSRQIKRADITETLTGLCKIFGENFYHFYPSNKAPFFKRNLLG